MSLNTADTTVTSLYMSDGLGSFLFARHYSGNHYCLLFHQLLRCFSSLGCLLASYGFRCRWLNITSTGLPHSEIHGSQVISTYPWLIAGNRVLLRLLVPRHPPYALSNLTKSLYFYTQIFKIINMYELFLTHFRTTASSILTITSQFANHITGLLNTSWYLRYRRYFRF